MNVSLRQLRMLVQVADLHSFTRGAEALHLSQSSVSRAVAELEAELGVALFERNTRTVETTTRGQAVVGLARDVVAGFDTGVARIEATSRDAPDRIRVAALPSITATILPRAISEYRRLRPETRVEIQTGHSSSLAERVRQGEADLAISVDEELGESLEFTPLATDEFVCLHPKDHPFARVPTLTWQRVASEPIVAFSTSSSVRTFTDRAFRDVGRSPVSVLETGEIATAAGLVAAGLGVMVATMLLLPLTRFADLQSSRLVEPVVSRRIGVVRVRDAREAPGTAMLVQQIRAAFTGLRVADRSPA